MINQLILLLTILCGVSSHPQHSAVCDISDAASLQVEMTIFGDVDSDKDSDEPHVLDSSSYHSSVISAHAFWHEIHYYPSQTTSFHNRGPPHVL